MSDRTAADSEQNGEDLFVSQDSPNLILAGGFILDNSD